MRQTRWPLILIVGIGLVAGVLTLRWTKDIEAEAQPVTEDRILMGTSWQIQVMPGPDVEREEVERAIGAAYAELERIEALMSEWRADSPISRLNRAAGTGAVAVPEELLNIIERSIRYGDLTEGAFDISWRALGRIWRLDDEFVVPSPEQVAEARRLVDYRSITISSATVAIPEGFSLGLGGVAKGYAIDRAGDVLRSSGLDHFLINGGGDILTRGSRGKRPWTIGVQAPRGRRADLVATVRVSGRAVVTSGDYERFQIINGVRFHHILDPRTGYPATAAQSVTVAADQAEKADVLSTAIFVLGPAKGLELASSQGVDVLIIDPQGQFWMNEGFRKIAEFLD